MCAYTFYVYYINRLGSVRILGRRLRHCAFGPAQNSVEYVIQAAGFEIRSDSRKTDNETLTIVV